MNYRERPRLRKRRSHASRAFRFFTLASHRQSQPEALARKSHRTRLANASGYQHRSLKNPKVLPTPLAKAFAASPLFVPQVNLVSVFVVGTLLSS